MITINHLFHISLLNLRNMRDALANASCVTDEGVLLTSAFDTHSTYT